MSAVEWRDEFAEIPTAGDHVLYRHDQNGEITDAIVVDVDFGWDENTPDPNVWQYDADHRPVTKDGQFVLKQCPWVSLALDAYNGRVVTRESRCIGSPGWFSPASLGINDA